MLPIVIKILLVIHVLVSLLIILLVLMQRPKNEGLGAAFGGGATDQLFGAQTTNVLQTITRWLGGIFFSLTLLLSILYVKQGGGRSPIQEKLSAKTSIPEPPAQPAGALNGKASNLEDPTAKPAEEATSEAVKAKLPPADGGPTTEKQMKAEDTAPAGDKTPEKDAPAPPAPPVPPPAENKSAEPAPEPNPPEPAK